MEGVRKVPWTNHDSGLTRNCRSCDALEGIHKYPLLHGSRYIYILMHISCPSKTLRMHANLMWSIVSSLTRIGMEGTRKPCPDLFSIKISFNLANFDVQAPSSLLLSPLHSKSAGSRSCPLSSTRTACIFLTQAS